MLHRGALKPHLHASASPHPGRCLHRRVRCFGSQNGTSNGTSNGVPKPTQEAPTAAETARTLASIVSEGSLSTLHNGTPLGTPVAFTLDPQGLPIVSVAKGSIEQRNLTNDRKCSLLVQPSTYPARAIASVTLLGSAEEVASERDDIALYKLQLESLLYFGGLGSTEQVVSVDVEQYKAAEPDVLRNVVVDLVTTWNSERAEDIYRILCSYLNKPLMEMQYAELLWVDRLGMYARVQLQGEAETVVRVPFYRPVLDERDARSVITMAAQLAWERERTYTPPPVSFYADSAAGNPSNN